MGAVVGISPRLHAALLAFLIALALLGIAAATALWLAARPGASAEATVRRILRNSAGPLGIQLFVRAIDLVFVKVLYVVFPQAAIGDYNFAGLLVTMILATVADWGLTVWLTREVARDRAALQRVFMTTVLVRLALALLMLPIGAIVVLGYAQLHAATLVANALSPQGILLIVILLPSLLPSTVAGAVTAVFLAHEQPTVPALANLLNNCISTWLQIGAVLLGFGIVGVAWGAAASTAINATIFIWLLLRQWGRPHWSWNRSEGRRMLREAFPLMLNGLLVVVFFRFDVLVIQGARTGGDVAVAIYNAAYKFANLALFLPPIVVNAIFPFFARQAINDRSALLRGYRMTVRFLLLFAFPLATTLAVLAPWAIGLLSERAYVQGGAPALRWLIWFVPISYVNGVAQYVLIALNRQSAITRAFLVTAIFNFIANLVLVPIFGINAAAAVTVVSELVLYLPFHRVLRRELGSAPFAALIWRPMLAAAVMAVAMAILRDYPPVAIGAGVGVYLAALWLLRTFTQDDRRLLQRLRG